MVAMVRTRMTTVAQVKVLQLQKEVETLRETERKLRSKEICCQNAKEMFLLKRGTTKQPSKEISENTLPKECEDNLQFVKIFGLLSEIKEQKKKLLMLRYQLHCEQMKREVGVISEILRKESEIPVLLSGRTADVGSESEISPLAVWYLEMVKAMKGIPLESHKGKFSEMNRLFYNLHYKNGKKEPCDILAESIRKKKIKRSQKPVDSVETLQFTTSYKGFCIQIVISGIVDDKARTRDDKASIEKKDCKPFMYQCYSDVQLDELQKHLMEELSARRPPDYFVREYVWKELEKFST